MNSKDSREGAKPRSNIEELSALVVENAYKLHVEGIKRIANNHQDFASSRLRVNQNSPTIGAHSGLG